MTLDYQEDFEFFKTIIENLNDDFTLKINHENKRNIKLFIKQNIKLKQYKCPFVVCSKVFNT